ncbi:MAG TPA: putative Ig domain-containing protein [Candidatus Saccharimonadales bacterium]|nr:putative Ig domain-containing protein [Candidatus Saccharimonadales bacterium]
MKILYRIRAFSLVTFVLVWTSQTGLLAQTGLAVVDWNDVHQRIDGFGASSAFLNINWTTAQADMFFSTNNGIGLSLLRTRIEPDGSADGTGIMRLAQARGARVWSTPWSPPAAFKDSGTVNGGNYLGGDATNAAYAQQLAGYAARMKTFLIGVNIYAISIQNEPDYNTTSYESCLWTAQQFHDFIPYLYNALAATNLSGIKIMLPEQASWRLNLATTSMNDATTSNMVGILAAHGYYSSATSLNHYGKTLWETEDSNLSGPFDGSITDGIYWATQIYSYLTVAEVNAWNYWWLISANPDNEGLTDQSGNPAKRMYVLGQWSRFVRPNFYRIGVNNNTSALVSAFMNPLSGSIAIVAVNPNANLPIVQTFTLTNVPMTAPVVPWVTSSNLSLASQPAVEVTNSTFTWQLPPYSVVTFVGQTDITNSPPTLQPIADQTIDPGVPLIITNVATDPDAFQTLTFNLLNGPTNVVLNSTNGILTWRPLVTDANTTNLFTVQVADNGSPVMTAQQSFTVTVNPLIQPQISEESWSNGWLVLQIGGAFGPDYAVQVSSNLFDWAEIFVTNSPPVPFQWVDTGATNWPNRFYRVKIGPPLP